MNQNKRPPTRTWFGLLIVAMVGELILYACISRLGWFGTGNVLLAACAVLFMSAPIVIGIYLFAKARFRFGMRTIFAVCFLVALFIRMTVLPLVHYNRERVGVRHMFENRVQLDESRYQASTVPVWLSPLLPRELSITDNSLDFVMLVNDREVKAFCQVAQRFTNLKTVLVYKVSQPSYEQLNQTLQQLPNLSQLDIGDSDPNKLVFDSVDLLKDVVFRETTGVQTPFKDEVLKDIVALPKIETLDIHEFDMNSNDLSILVRAKKLTKLRFYRCRVSDEKVEELKRLMPQTEIILESVPNPT